MGESRAAQAEAEKKHCQSFQDVDRESGDHMCLAPLLEKFGSSYDPKGATQHASVYAGTCDKMVVTWRHAFFLGWGSVLTNTTGLRIGTVLRRASRFVIVREIPNATPVGLKSSAT